MTDIEIARAAKAFTINEIGAKLGILPSHLIPYGHNKAKVSNEFLQEIADRHSFSVTFTTPAAATGTEAMSSVYGGLEILMDTDNFLILQKLNKEDADVSVYIVNKLTDSFLEQTVSMSYEYGRAEGTCLIM